MAGTSPLTARVERRAGLARLAAAANRAEAGRARAILLSLVRSYRTTGGKSAAIGAASGGREDTARGWRSTFLRDGVAGIERHLALGASPVKAEAARAVARELFEGPVENQINWTLPRLPEEIERRTLHRISHSRLPGVPRKKGALPASVPATR